MNPKHPAPPSGEPTEVHPAPAQARVVYCARCDHPNNSTHKTCQRCGAHLFITCHNCGRRNERAAHRCDECGQRLHRSWFGKLRKKFRSGSRHLSLGQLTLLALALALAFLLIHLLNQVKLSF